MPSVTRARWYARRAWGSPSVRVAEVPQIAAFALTDACLPDSRNVLMLVDNPADAEQIAIELRRRGRRVRVVEMTLQRDERLEAS